MKRHMRDTRRRYSLQDCIQIHHVIPKQHARHQTLAKFDFDIDGRYNLMFVPTRAGMQTMNLRTQRFIHDGGHMAYNRYVNTSLLDVTNEEELYELIRSLSQRIRHGDASLPWF